MDINNWKMQMRKGYLELCILALIHEKKKLYGLEILELLSEVKLSVKEGTLYPLLSRLSEDGLLSSSWVTENNKGHPRKFYSLTKDGQKLSKEMNEEFQNMISILEKLKK
ncbi:MAG: PadR family transcriptional regulator [Bdellovibrionota bacterium]